MNTQLPDTNMESFPYSEDDPDATQLFPGFTPIEEYNTSSANTPDEDNIGMTAMLSAVPISVGTASTQHADAPNNSQPPYLGSIFAHLTPQTPTTPATSAIPTIAPPVNLIPTGPVPQHNRPTFLAGTWNEQEQNSEPTIQSNQSHPTPPIPPIPSIPSIPTASNAPAPFSFTSLAQSGPSDPLAYEPLSSDLAAVFQSAFKPGVLTTEHVHAAIAFLRQAIALYNSSPMQRGQSATDGLLSDLEYVFGPLLPLFLNIRTIPHRNITSAYFAKYPDIHLQLHSGKASTTLEGAHPTAIPTATISTNRFSADYRDYFLPNDLALPAPDFVKQNESWLPIWTQQIAALMQVPIHMSLHHHLSTRMQFYVVVQLDRTSKAPTRIQLLLGKRSDISKYLVEGFQVLQCALTPWAIIRQYEEAVLDNKTPTVNFAYIPFAWSEVTARPPRADKGIPRGPRMPKM